MSGVHSKTGRRTVALVAADLSTGGGVNRVIRDLAVLFREKLGYDVRVISARSGAKPTYPFPSSIPIAFHRGKSLLSYVRVLWRLRRTRPDVALGFWTQDNILLLFAFLFSGTRVIVCEHQSHDRPSPHVRLLRRLLYPTAACVTVLNRAELDHYSAFLSNVRLVSNPATVQAAEPDGRRDKLVIGVGHLFPGKGFRDLVIAWSRSGLAQRGWRLAIIGEGPERATIEAQAQGTRGIEIVAPTPDIADWYRRASIIAVTSYSEVFSLVLAEAALSGVIPIAYATDGPAYLLEDVPHLLVPTGDVEMLARRLRDVALEPDRETLQADARKSVEARVSNPRVVEDWRSLLQSPMSRAAAR